MTQEDRLNYILEQIRLGRTAPEIAKEMACTMHYIYKLCRQYGLKRSRATPGPKPLDEKRPISPLHSRIGFDVAKYRDLDMKLSYHAMIERLGMSLEAQTRADTGRHDFKLSELQRIAKMLDVKLSKLVEDER